MNVHAHNNAYMYDVHVCVVYSADEVMALASQMLGYRLFTKQTGAVGRPCNHVSDVYIAVLPCHNIHVPLKSYYMYMYFTFL